ncbi:hypothetical protein FZ103_10590 [Streptomonospora sp. PA3]|uniref:hypothetical protein n=1 Tax=Streptomonospora sp. PA3 TaxID=2607326 RepID=UPI0012DFA328|nr:hypothetical protein [Streptomonospora sp. PA3]MUL41618.1 hypothetical protein [Streptomonospora sp. PA3]
MKTLVHTGLRVPTDRIRITRLEQVDLGFGIAWSARLCDGSTILGELVDDGRGSQTHFRPSSGEAQRVVEEFAARCRSPEGAALSTDRVLDLLADEYDYAREVAEAEARGCYLVRGFDDHGIPTVQTLTVPGTGPPDYAAALEAATRLPPPARAVRAQLWMGPRRGWADIPAPT